MKKSIVASILGIAAVVSVANSYGQGFIIFENYNYNSPVTDGGVGVNNTYNAGLWYAFGAGVVNPNAGDPAALPGAPFAAVSSFTGSPQINAGIFAGPGGEGFFNAGSATIPGYVSGAVTFVVTAENTPLSKRGHSAAITISSLATGATPPGDFGVGFGVIPVAQVPEPSTLALIGLGTGALLFMRRRK